MESRGTVQVMGRVGAAPDCLHLGGGYSSRAMGPMGAGWLQWLLPWRGMTEGRACLFTVVLALYPLSVPANYAGECCVLPWWSTRLPRFCCGTVKYRACSPHAAWDNSRRGKTYVISNYGGQVFACD
jgi:hypothetical protein